MRVLIAIGLSLVVGVGVLLLGVVVSALFYMAGERELGDAVIYIFIAVAVLTAAMVIPGIKRWLDSRPLKEAANRRRMKHAELGRRRRDAYAVAEKEVRENRVDEGTWAEALVVAQGREELRKAKYLELRANHLLEDQPQNADSEDKAE